MEFNIGGVGVRPETGSIGLRAWHAVRVLPGPPRSPAFAEISRRPAKSPQMAPCVANAWSLEPVIWIWRAVWAPYSLASNSRFPETETAAARDWFDYRTSAEVRPSTWRCRDHSAGMSQRRANPIPRGSRPSMAVLTRSGARNASEIVMLTFRALQPSRFAIACTFAIGSALSSSRSRLHLTARTKVSVVTLEPREEVLNELLRCSEVMLDD
jgi:hypothetical protein